MFRAPHDSQLASRARSDRPPTTTSPRHATPRRARLRPPPRWLLIALGAFVVVIAGLAIAFGPIVRSRVAKEADRRKLDVDVGSVRPGFFAVTLRDVKARPRGVPGVEARLDEVRVEMSAGFSVQEVKAKGGGIFIEGEPDDVAQRLRDFKKTSAPDEAAPASAPSSSKPISAEDLSLTWKLPSGGAFTGAGLRASRDPSGIKLGCLKCAASETLHHLTLEVTEADIDLAPDGSPRHIKATTLTVAHEPPKSAESKQASSAATEIAPPPLPIAIAPTKKKGKVIAVAAPAPPPSAPDEPVLPLPDLHAMRARIATAVAAFAPRIPDGGSVEIGGLTLKLDVGGEPIAFGPGAFTLTRTSDRVHLGFASGASIILMKDATRDDPPPTVPGGTPLSIDADLPVAGGEMTARLAGGPVSLAMLGVKEGTKGITDVTKGTVSGKGQLVLSAPADALTFDGQVTLRSISMKQPRISPEPLRGIDFSLSARGVLDDIGRLRVDDAQLDMGALHVKTHGTIEESPAHFALSLAIDVAPASCQALLDSSPQGLLPTVRAARMGGTFGANLNLAFDTRTIDKLALDYRIDDQCRMLEVPRDLSHDHFGGAFTYKTYKPDGTIGESTTGPGTPNWTNLDDISPFMIAAVLTTEDGAFYKHHGFNHAAIRSSVQANLKARRFVRGASTITMQLAKNLFLARDKAMSRKIEEVILTDYLEQIFRKDDMMELYLNVVEFGPDVYGITQAAEYYFGRKPEELHLGECFFLASLLPSPIRYGKLREKGEVSETWMRHLTALMEIAARNGKITHAELEEGLKETIVFYRPGEPRPEPRKPVTSTRRDPMDDDAAWRPLD